LRLRYLRGRANAFLRYTGANMCWLELTRDDDGLLLAQITAQADTENVVLNSRSPVPGFRPYKGFFQRKPIV